LATFRGAFAAALTAFLTGAVVARTARPAARVVLFAADFAVVPVGRALPVALVTFLVARRFAGAFPAPRFAAARGARVVDAVARLGVDVLATAEDPPRDC
jgi:hypothetical protein